MIDPLLALVHSIASEAAQFALEQRRGGVSVAATKSSEVDIVTQVDSDTESLIRRRIREARPADGFFGEESGAEAGTSGLTWVVDPIDGTVNFLYGIPQWAVSVAVVEGEPDPQTWRALAGVVINPSIGEVFAAKDGAGATLGDTALTLPEPPPLELALVGTGFSYDADRRARQGSIVAELLPRVRDIRRIGAASLDLAGVAAGRLDAYVERGLQPWDHAAGALIAREAGAAVLGVPGEQPDARLTVAGGPALAEALQQFVVERGYLD